jgi:hypothetical protein
MVKIGRNIGGRGLLIVFFLVLFVNKKKETIVVSKYV